MRSTRPLVIGSLILSIASMVGAIYSAPAMSRNLAIHDDLVPTILSGVLMVVICSWPWFLAYSKAQDPRSKFATALFSIASALIAFSMFKPIASAPSEGVGYYVAIYVLGTWVIGPLVLRIRSEA
jgi:hypothetical protein